jgi:hypothetical protein
LKEKKIKGNKKVLEEKTHPPLVAVLHQLPAGAVLSILGSLSRHTFSFIQTFFIFPLSYLQQN